MSGPTLNLLPALPELLVAVGAMALLMVGVFLRQDATRLLSWAGVVLLAVAALVMRAAPEAAFGGMFINDAFAVFMKRLVLVGAALGLIMSLDFNERERAARFEFPILILFATTGMMLMVSANDLISLYLGLELQSLALYVIAAFQRESVRSTEAGLKYFVLGALSSGLLLYGASLVYGFAGTTSFGGIATVLQHGEPLPMGIVFGIVFVAAGLAFKVSAVPFHMWTPDVYEGAPTPVTAFFSIAPKVAAIALLVRVFAEPFYGAVDAWRQIIIVVAVLSMALGAFAAIWQVNIKRLMAYSSIGHIGYALVGLAAGNQAGVEAVLVYIAIYVFMNAAAFAVILAMRRDGKAVERIDDLAGLARSQPVVAAALAVAMFAMAGIPPLSGFFGKLYVFMAAVQAGQYALAVFGVLASVVGAYYYIRIVKVMYFDEAGQPLDRAMAPSLSLVLTVGSLFTLLFFLLPSPLVAAAAQAAASLFPGQ